MKPSCSRTHLALILIATFGVAVRLYVYFSSHWTILDGFIGYRFAEQFSQGNGLVFNAGEKVSGNTSVLFTFLLGVVGCLHVSIPVAARAFGLAADVLSLFLMFRLIAHHAELKSWQWQVGIPAAVFLYPLTLPYAVSGMETCCYVCLVLLLIERTLARAKWTWFAAAGLIMYCRPDGVVFVAMMLTFLLVDGKRIPWTHGLVAFGIGLSYLAFNYAYYGTVIPNTLLTKSAATADSIAENFRFISSRFFRSQILLGVFLLLLVAAVTWLRKNRLALVLGLCAVGYVVFLLKAPHLRTWYVIPFLYVSLLLFGVAAAQVMKLKFPAPPVPLFALGAAVYLLGAALGLHLMLRELQGARHYEVATRRIPGEWLRTNTPPNARVFVTALEVGYFSRRFTYDSPGLVTPQVWKLIKTNPAITLLEQAEAVNADYVLIPRGTPPSPKYEFIREFACEPPTSPYFTIVYALYQRSSSAAGTLPLGK